MKLFLYIYIYIHIHTKSILIHSICLYKSIYKSSWFSRDYNKSVIFMLPHITNNSEIFNQYKFKQHQPNKHE